MRGLERHLLIDDAAFARMIERAFAAFALADVLRRPVMRERVAFGEQRIDQRAGGRIVQMADRVRAEFGDEPPRPRFPIDDQRARGGRGEREAQQVALVALAVEPADEERGGRVVPGERVPLAVEHVRGRRDQLHGGDERIRHVARRELGLGRVALRGELEQIRALGARQPQRDGDARERVG
ncbi:hypothetical protein Y601_5995 [Burkholderia pseudomallei MSHR640]|nr:hypothetical protein Y601_5995 [Burkholderia pseudomallei MSHR640]